MSSFSFMTSRDDIYHPELSEFNAESFKEAIDFIKSVLGLKTIKHSESLHHPKEGMVYFILQPSDMKCAMFEDIGVLLCRK